MSEDSDQGADVARVAEPTSSHAAFVRDAYAAAFDRIPSPEEVEEQSAHLDAGLALQDFLSSLLRSEEREAVLAAREARQVRGPAVTEEYSRFVAQVYRVVLGREADEDGLAIHVAIMDDGRSFSDVLALLHDTDEAVAYRKRLSGPTIDMEGFVRATFEAVLHRPPEDSAVAWFASALRETMDLEGFARGLAESPEGRNLRGQQGSRPLNVACVNLTLFLEAMLRHRGMVLDLGPPPCADLTAPAAEQLLKKLARTIEMLSTEAAPA